MMTWRDLMRSGRPLPDDTQLPCEDGKFAKSSLEAPLREILTESMWRWLDPRHRGRLPYFISGNSGIYWRLPEPPEPLINGAIDPDWFYVPQAPPVADGRLKSSYVMWHERVPPLVALEFVLPEDVEARDQTPWKGKYWIYEQALGVPYYGIYEMEAGCLEVFELHAEKYRPINPNARGHYEIPPLELELGVLWKPYWNLESWWLRWWDAQGNLIQTSREWLDEQQRQAYAAAATVRRLEQQLRALGVDPESV